MMNNTKLPIQLTARAISKIKYLFDNNKLNKKNNPNLKLRVYITGGGCGGFQYGFILDNTMTKDDYVMDSDGIQLVIDFMSLRYLFGGTIDYYEGLEGSKFVVINPNAITTCSCGLSFSI